MRIWKVPLVAYLHIRVDCALDTPDHQIGLIARQSDSSRIMDPDTELPANVLETNYELVDDSRILFTMNDDPVLETNR